jgi:hypothetical protein
MPAWHLHVVTASVRVESKIPVFWLAPYIDLHTLFLLLRGLSKCMQILGWERQSSTNKARKEGGFVEGKGRQVSKHQSTALPKMQPSELYALCEQHEKTIEKRDYRKNLQLLYEHWLFARPLFESKPLAGYKPFDRFNQGLYPYRFSIAQGLSIPRSKVGWRYRKLLENLKKLPGCELRWLLIARWLKQERVCEPKQFLPDDVLRNLVKKFSQRERVSPTDFRDGMIVRTWLPYFEQVQAELLARKNLSRAREEVSQRIQRAT